MVPSDKEEEEVGEVEEEEAMPARDGFRWHQDVASPLNVSSPPPSFKVPTSKESPPIQANPIQSNPIRAWPFLLRFLEDARGILEGILFRRIIDFKLESSSAAYLSIHPRVCVIDKSDTEKR